MTRYRIDPARSRLVIDASSSVHPIHSESEGLEGWLELDHPDGPRAHLEFPVDRLRSGTPLEDRKLNRRIDARRFPSITGDLTSMEPLDAEGRYRVRGDV